MSPDETQFRFPYTLQRVFFCYLNSGLYFSSVRHFIFIFLQYCFLLLSSVLYFSSVWHFIFIFLRFCWHLFFMSLKKSCFKGTDLSLHSTETWDKDFKAWVIVPILNLTLWSAGDFSFSSLLLFTFVIIYISLKKSHFLCRHCSVSHPSVFHLKEVPIF